LRKRRWFPRIIIKLGESINLSKTCPPNKFFGRLEGESP